MTRSGGAHSTTAAAEPANGLVHVGEANIRIVKVMRVVGEVCEVEAEVEAVKIINGRSQ
jgi:hypothetical protein